METNENSEKEELRKAKNLVKGLQVGLLSFWTVFLIAAGIYIFNKVQQGDEFSKYVMLITILMLLSVGMLLPIYVLRKSIDKKNNSESDYSD